MPVGTYNVEVIWRQKLVHREGNILMDAIRQMTSLRIIITPGCTYPLGVPHANLMAMRNAVETPALDI